MFVVHTIVIVVLWRMCACQMSDIVVQTQTLLFYCGLLNYLITTTTLLSQCSLLFLYTTFTISQQYLIENKE